MRIRVNYRDNKRVVTLTKNDIILLLQMAGANFSQEDEVTLRVPGGGDWSNMKVDISNDPTDQDSLIVVESSLPDAERPVDLVADLTPAELRSRKGREILGGAAAP